MIRSSDLFRNNFMRHVIGSEDDGLYLAAPMTDEALEKILIEMLFALPIQSNRFYFLPNPSSRFCLDLRKSNISWFRNKQMRKHLPEFTIEVTHDLKEGLEIAEKYHNEFHESTWLTTKFSD